MCRFCVLSLFSLSIRLLGACKDNKLKRKNNDPRLCFVFDIDDNGSTFILTINISIQRKKPGEKKKLWSFLKWQIHMRALSSPFVAGSRFCFWFCFFSFLFLFWVCVLCMCSSLILPLFGCRHRFHNWTKVIRSMSVQYAYILAHTKKNKRNQHEDKKKHFLYIHSESILFFFWNFLFGVFFSIDVAICEIVSYVCVYVFRYHNLETRTKTRFKWWQSRAPKHRHIHIRQILLSTSRRFGILSFCFDCNQSQPNQSKTKTQWNYKLIVFGETKHSLICFEFLQDEKKTRRRRKAKYDKRHFIFRLRIKIGLQLLPFYNDFVLCLAKRKRETHKKKKS